MIERCFIEDQADSLAHKAYEFIVSQRSRGATPQTPAHAITSASWSTRLSTKFGTFALKKIKARAKSILEKMLRDEK